MTNKVLPLFLAGFLLFGLHSIASANPNVTTQTGSSSTASDNSKSVIDPVCDPSVYNRMRQKAWMEAQRENYTNQSIIKQPDSIFAATCYDQQLNIAKNSLGVPEGTGSSANTQDFQNAVQNTSGQVAGAFMAPYSGTAPQNPGGGSGFNCGAMQQIWKDSSCSNFAGSTLASLADVGRSKVDARGECGGSRDDDSGTSASKQFNYNTIFADMAKPGAGVENFDAADPRRCATLPFSELSAAGCEEKCTSTPTGLKYRGKDEVSCQPGCVAELGGDSWECVRAD